ncbi:MAG: hypothetical protein M3421_09110, partial [Bacteroidota bacterium]|nr:hypothetical protein [Bacteroidota bacterium]
MLKNYPFKGLSIITTCIIYFASIFNSFSQNYSDITWYFGQNGTALQFNKNDFEANKANNQHAPLGNGGSAMAVDPITGNILFYTDGVKIYDGSGAPISPGTLTLNGDPGSNQPAAISPIPGVEDNYFVFVNTGNGLTSTRIDMNQPGNASNAGQPPLGAVIPPSVQNFFTGDINEAMLVIPGSSPDVFYLVVQETNGDYKVFTIDGLTISAPQTFSFPQGAAITAANFAYNPATNQIAVSPKGAGQDVQILDFNPATGTLSFK